MASKSPQAFRTIREVADWLGIEAHVLRFWESKFNQIKPVKRAGGRRYYRPADMRLVGGIKVLLHDQGLTIRGVQKMISDDGISKVAAMSPDLDEELLDNDVLEVAALTAAPAEAAPEIATDDDIATDDSALTERADIVDAVTPEPETADAAPDDPEEALDVAPPFVTTPPETQPTPVVADGADYDSLSTLRALVKKSLPLTPEQSTALASKTDRLQELAERLTAKARSA